MKMPGTGPCHTRKKHYLLYAAVVLLLVGLLSVSGVTAEVPVIPACSEVDQFGNPVCPDIQPVDQPVATVQGIDMETASYTTGITNTFGQVKDLVPAAQGSAAELLEIAGSGIKGSINQTRHSGEYEDQGNDETGTGQDLTTLDEKEDPGIKGRMTELAEIVGLGLKNSINQTIHADEYSSLTTPGPGNITETVPDVESEEEAPNILRATYAGIIRNILQFIDITPRAFKGSLRNYSTSNTSIWTNRPADDLIGSPLKAPDTDERFILTLDLPVTRLIKDLTPNPSLLLATNSSPVVVLPVLPTPTPVPVPVFNLSVDSDPDGALIVLNGNRTGTTPYVMTGLEKNTYTMTLTRAGYQVYNEVVTLDTDKTLDIPLTSTMETLFVIPGKSEAQNRYGGIYVTSFPNNLDLAIDGVEITGGTPFLYYGLPEGLHTITVIRTDKQSGPATYTRSVWVYHDALTRFNVDTEIVLLAKRVSINSGPYSGAEFTINGRFPAGRLPATISAGCPGSFIGVKKGDAYASFLIPCTNQDTVTMNLASKEEPHPPLQINSVPEGAEIFIDGFRTGYTTPHTFTEVSEGLHRIMVSKPGLYPEEEIITVEIRDKNTTPQKFFFPMENYGEGTIVVDSLPRGASIYLNGWTPGEVTPHTFDHMKIGFYEVTVLMGPKPWIEQIELVPSQVSKIVADFEI
jgi:hypothetical protein